METTLNRIGGYLATARPKLDAKQVRTLAHAIAELLDNDQDILVIDDFEQYIMIGWYTKKIRLYEEAMGNDKVLRRI